MYSYETDPCIRVYVDGFAAGAAWTPRWAAGTGLETARVISLPLKDHQMYHEILNSHYPCAEHGSTRGKSNRSSDYTRQNKK